MLNKVHIIGRLGKDPEAKYTAGGEMVVNFSVATDEQWKDKAGEKVQKTTWHNIVVWGKLAEICNQYLVKGKLVYIEGKISNSTWDDKDGVKHYKSEIVASTMKMLSGGEGKSGSKDPKNQPQDAEQTADESDVPF